MTREGGGRGAGGYVPFVEQQRAGGIDKTTGRAYGLSPPSGSQAPAPRTVSRAAPASGSPTPGAADSTVESHASRSGLHRRRYGAPCRQRNGTAPHTVSTDPERPQGTKPIHRHSTALRAVGR
jgi:hypothetical protein